MDQITDYASLQAAVAGMLHRDDDTDITANTLLFVQLCEADLNDRHLLKDYEQEDALATTTSVNYIALPSGFVSPLAAWILISSQRVPLYPALPEQLPYDDNTSIPKRFAVDGANLRFDCPANAVYTVYLRYVKKSNLSVSTTTNALLLRRPDVYLYGALWQAGLFTGDESSAKWFGLYEQSIQKLRNADSRSRSDVALRTDFGRRRSNILTDG